VHVFFGKWQNSKKEGKITVFQAGVQGYFLPISFFKTKQTDVHELLTTTH
jgi:hypothetical protein